MVGITWQNPSLLFLDWQRFVPFALFLLPVELQEDTHPPQGTHSFPSDLGLVSPRLPSRAAITVLDSVVGM